MGDPEREDRTPRESVPGACLCGAVRFEASLPTTFCVHCHCTLCRKAHTAGFVTWFSVPRARLEVIDPESKLVRYGSSSHATRSFCGVCGSTLFFETSRDPDRVDIALACAKAPIDREPSMHVYFSDGVPWSGAESSLPRLGGDTGFEPLDD